MTRQQGIETVREMGKEWIAHRKAVDELEAGGREDPVGMVCIHASNIAERMTAALVLLDDEFAITHDPLDTHTAISLRWRDARVALKDEEELALLCDTLQSVRTLDDARVALNKEIVNARERGEPRYEAAKNACDAVIHVLRSRPLLYSQYLFAPASDGARDWKHEAKGLSGLRIAAANVISGLVRSQLRLGNWMSSSRSGGTNRLRSSLQKRAGTESVEDHLLGELPAECLVAIDDILNIVEHDPAFALDKLNYKSLRNRVARSIVKSTSEEESVDDVEQSSVFADDEAAAELYLLGEEELSACSEQLDEMIAAACLSPQQVEIVRMTRQGIDNETIASTLETSDGNVRKQKSIAVKKIRRAAGKKAS